MNMQAFSTWFFYKIIIIIINQKAYNYINRELFVPIKAKQKLTFLFNSPQCGSNNFFSNTKE